MNRLALLRSIRRQWFPPRDGASAEVSFDIGTTGELHSLKLERSSGYSDCDSPALKAIENAAPFEQLPAGIKQLHVQLRLDPRAFMILPRSKE